MKNKLILLGIAAIYLVIFVSVSITVLGTLSYIVNTINYMLDASGYRHLIRNVMIIISGIITISVTGIIILCELDLFPELIWNKKTKECKK